MKFCEKCGNKIKDGFQFCDKCGAKVGKKEDKKEEEKKETKKEVEKPVYQPIPVKPVKSGRGMTIFLTITSLLLLAAAITFLVLWLIKPTSKDCNPKSYSNGGNDNTEKEPTKKPVESNDKYIGRWEQNIEYQYKGETIQRLYGLIELRKDDTFRSLYYDKDDIDDTKEEIEGTYTISGNIVTLKYEDFGETETITLKIKDDKLCVDNSCESYLVKDSYNNKIIIETDGYFADDDDDDDDDYDTIKTITYSEYEDLLDEKEDAVVVVVRAGCSWCEKFEPVVEELADEFYTSFYYYKLDDKIGVDSTPTTLLIKDGKVVKKIVGYYDLETMEDYLSDNDID